MIQKEIAARVPANKEKGTQEMAAVIVVNYAETLKEAKEMFSEEAVLTNAFANWRVTLQSNVRAKLKAGSSQEDIQASLADAKMGVAATGAKVDPEQAFIAKFKTATPEKQADMLKLLKSAAQK